MRGVSPEDEAAVRRSLATFSWPLGVLPFVGLKPMKKHRWGNLKAWPKWKTLRVVWELERKRAREGAGAAEERTEEEEEAEREGWAYLRWRPLVSYAAHHLAGLFTVLCRFCTTAIRTLGLGFLRSNVRGVLETFHEFNERQRQPGGVRARQRRRRRQQQRGGDDGGQQAEEAGPRRLARWILDIKNFFVEVPREEFMQSLGEVIRRLNQKDRAWRFF